jgi:hypothetical protein
MPALLASMLIVSIILLLRVGQAYPVTHPGQGEVHISNAEAVWYPAADAAKEQETPDL